MPALILALLLWSGPAFADPYTCSAGGCNWQTQYTEPTTQTNGTTLTDLASCTQTVTTSVDGGPAGPPHTFVIPASAPGGGGTVTTNNSDPTMTPGHVYTITTTLFCTDMSAGASLPTVSATLAMNNNLKTGKPLALVAFSPRCDAAHGCTFQVTYTEPTMLTSGSPLTDLTQTTISYTISVDGGPPGPATTRVVTASRGAGGGLVAQSFAEATRAQGHVYMVSVTTTATSTVAGVSDATDPALLTINAGVFPAAPVSQPAFFGTSGRVR